jgi:hypothetical protein
MTIYMKTSFARIPAVLALVALAACGNTIGNQGDSDALRAAQANSQDSSTNTVQSVVSVVNQAALLAESVGGVAPTGLSAFAGTCPSSRSGCTVNARTVAYADCTLGRYSVNGAANLSYDSASTCTAANTAMPTSGSVTRTSAGLVLSVPNNGGTLNVTSDNSPAYTGESVGGGLRVSFNSATAYSIAVLGLNRVRFAADGLRIFDHSIKTSSDLQVTGTFAGRDRTVSTGSIVLHHNRLQVTATSTLTGLIWNDLGCCHPRAGTVASTIRNLAGTTVETWNLEFGAAGLTCGQVKATITANGRSQVSTLTLADCE